MAIQIFNLSLGFKDVVTNCISEDLTLNDQEMEIEPLLEKVNLISYFSKKSFFSSQIVKISPSTIYLTAFHQSPTFDIFVPPPNA